MNEYLHSKKIVIDFLTKYIDEKFGNKKIKEMVKYSVNGGKKLRPIIIISVLKIILKSTTAEIIANKLIFESLFTCVIFVELLHSASLILDDLPCMDNDKLRRGQATFHIKYGIKNSYLVSNLIIGSVSSDIVKQILIPDNSKILNNLINEIFDSNLLISLGQILDLNETSKSYFYVSKIINRLTNNHFIKQIFIKFCNDINLDIKDTISNVIKLNLKTYPLFYLAFFCPILLINVKQVNQKNININSILSKIETIALCFSIMFQSCDDFEDFEKDKLTTKFNSHLKFFDKFQLQKLYMICREEFVVQINNLNNVYNNNYFDNDCNDSIKNSKELKFFVELLDKKIKLYDNGEDTKIN